MFDCCAICMIKNIDLVELGNESRRLMEAIVSPLIDLAPLKDCCLLLCLDCNRVLTTIIEFQLTVFKGMRNLICLQKQKNKEMTCHNLPEVMNGQSCILSPVVSEQIVDEEGIFYVSAYDGPVQEPIQATQPAMYEPEKTLYCTERMIDRTTLPDLGSTDVCDDWKKRVLELVLQELTINPNASSLGIANKYGISRKRVQRIRRELKDGVHDERLQQVGPAIKQNKELESKTISWTKMSSEKQRVLDLVFQELQDPNASTLGLPKTCNTTRRKVQKIRNELKDGVHDGRLQREGNPAIKLNKELESTVCRLCSNSRERRACRIRILSEAEINNLDTYKEKGNQKPVNKKKVILFIERKVPIFPEQQTSISKNSVSVSPTLERKSEKGVDISGSRSKQGLDLPATLSFDSDLDNPDTAPGYELVVATSSMNDHWYADTTFGSDCVPYERTVATCITNYNFMDFDNPDPILYERLVGDFDNPASDPNDMAVLVPMKNSRDNRPTINTRSSEAKKVYFNRRQNITMKLPLGSGSKVDDTQPKPKSTHELVSKSTHNLDSFSTHNLDSFSTHNLDSLSTHSESTLTCHSDYEDAELFPNIAFANAFKGVLLDEEKEVPEDIKTKLHVVTNPPSEWPCTWERCYQRHSPNNEECSDDAGNNPNKGTRWSSRHKECKLCDKTFVSLYRLWVHYEREHVDVCAKECCNGTELKNPTKQRLEFADPSPRYSCQECGVDCRYKGQITAHLATQRHLLKSQWRFQCDICKRKFEDKKHIAEHIERAHVAKEATTCPMCSLAFRSARALRKHAAAHILAQEARAHAHDIRASAAPAHDVDAHAQETRASAGGTRKRRRDDDRRNLTPGAEVQIAASALDSSQGSSRGLYRTQKYDLRLLRKAVSDSALTNGRVPTQLRKQNPGNKRKRTHTPGNARKPAQNARKRTKNARLRKAKRRCVGDDGSDAKVAAMMEYLKNETWVKAAGVLNFLKANGGRMY